MTIARTGFYAPAEKARLGSILSENAPGRGELHFA